MRVVLLFHHIARKVGTSLRGLSQSKVNERDKTSLYSITELLCRVKVT